MKGDVDDQGIVLVHCSCMETPFDMRKLLRYPKLTQDERKMVIDEAIAINDRAIARGAPNSSFINPLSGVASHIPGVEGEYVWCRMHGITWQPHRGIRHMHLPDIDPDHDIRLRKHGWFSHKVEDNDLSDAPVPGYPDAPSFLHRKNHGIVKFDDGSYAYMGWIWNYEAVPWRKTAPNPDYPPERFIPATRLHRTLFWETHTPIVPPTSKPSPTSSVLTLWRPEDLDDDA